MSYSKTNFIKITGCFCLLLTLLISSCKKDTTIVPAALNSFEGIAEGTSFTAEIQSVVENDELFSLVGNINTDANFLLYFKGNTLNEYPVDTAGPFPEVTNIIKEIADRILGSFNEADFNIDTALTELNTAFTEKLDSVLAANENQVLLPNESYMFYIINQSLYFPKSGSIELNRYDSELNRIDGSIDIELQNLFNGLKSFEATFEDLEFIKQ